MLDLFESVLHNTVPSSSDTCFGCMPPTPGGPRVPLTCLTNHKSLVMLPDAAVPSSTPKGAAEGKPADDRQIPAPKRRAPRLPPAFALTRWAWMFVHLVRLPRPRVPHTPRVVYRIEV